MPGFASWDRGLGVLIALVLPILPRLFGSYHLVGDLGKGGVNVLTSIE